eukprot:35830_1
MLITDAVGTGACCNSDGSCQGSVSGGDCFQNNGYWQAETASCTDGQENACPIGACCGVVDFNDLNSELECVDIIKEACTGDNSDIFQTESWRGEGTSCIAGEAGEPKTCPDETGACCISGENRCMNLVKELCHDAFWQGEDTSCTSG